MHSNYLIHKNNFYAFFYIILIGLFSSPVNADQKVDYISIATGDVNGVYYPTGGAICYLLNNVSSVDHVRCQIKSTTGSFYNLQALRNGQVDLAVAQSDSQYHAYNASGLFKKSLPFKQLRSLFSVYTEPFTVLVRKNDEIKHFDDIKGKRINIGIINSGQRETMDMLLTLYGWKYSDFSSVTSLSPGEQASALCHGKVDVVIYVAGHPNSSMKEASNLCDTKLIDVVGPELFRYVTEHDYYKLTTIPSNLYQGNPQTTHTFGVGATVVTTSALSDEVAYQIVRSVFENQTLFVQLHPAFKTLTKKGMSSHYLSAPLHPGAIRYYKEVGLY